MHKTRKPTVPDGKEVWNQLESIRSLGYSRSDIFTDWLDFMLNILLSTTDNLARRTSQVKILGHMKIDTW